MIIRTLLPPELKCKINKNSVSNRTAQKKNLMNELKSYHRIDNFSTPIQLLIMSMLKKWYPELWSLTKGNINYLIDVYNLMKDCNCFHCKYITHPYIPLLSYRYFPTLFLWDIVSSTWNQDLSTKLITHYFKICFLSKFLLARAKIIYYF